MGKYYNLCVKKVYKNREGKEVTKWPQVGIMRVNDDGKQFIDIPLFSHAIYVFEAKAKNEAHAQAQTASKPQGQDFQDDDIPW